MEVDEAQARMREIQRIMETATLFTLLPGTAAIVGGLLVLLGCGVSYWLLNSLDFADIVQLSMPGRVALVPDVVCHRRGQRCRERCSSRSAWLPGSGSRSIRDRPRWPCSP